MMQKGVVYKIQSRKKPERVYIGSSRSVVNRWRQHKYDLRNNRHTSRTLQRHYDKYGEGDLEFSVVAVCNIDELIPINGVIWIEQCFMFAYKEKNKKKPYFNANPTAGSNLGMKMRRESVRKSVKTNKGRKRPPLSAEACKNISESKMGILNPMYGKGYLVAGRKHTKKAKKKMSIGHKGKNNNTPEQIENTRNRMIGNQYGKLGAGVEKKPFTKEHKKHLSESHLGQKPSQETIEKRKVTLMLRKIENDLIDMLIESMEDRKGAA